ncbi:GH25 family lysozyme [Parabacteroides sp. PF5-6]|uniref:glycoside hydrolase family 25 protein n=1 Tax=Parabacteroides sp. PF5-6 TaxID=1742403 RepID=UPI002406E1F1|nr:GH25 family lysozyme [Parabacteroides sp. PF5-6]MDF9828847.1 lysozyme [Parabacteroides sp. PF5-6]
MKTTLYLLTVLCLGLSCISSTELKRDAKYHGIDVSRHQKQINWEQVAKDQNIQFVYIKATEGQTHTDPKYKRNIREARRNGLKVGSYHYFRTSSSAHAQFEHFKKTAKKADQDLIPLVDVEEINNWTRSQFQDSLKVFIRLVKEHYGKAPMIYSVNSFYNTNCAPEFNNYHLMIGRYNNDPRKHPTVKGQGTYTIWQYSESGTVDGIPRPVDLNRFNPKYSVKDLLLK